MRLLVLMATLLAPLAAAAQSSRPTTVWLGAGWTFPSGGDWSDTYGEGPHALVDVRHEIAPRWALRGGVTEASFVSQAFRGHPKESRRGNILGVSAGATYAPPLADDHLYLLAGAGTYAVSGTWLTAHDSIDPYRTQVVVGVDVGIGVTILSHGFLEGRHHITFRPTRNWARFIPITLGWRM
ncbi:MAG: hypothetical protein ABJD07_13935 [Gemmatimonadaceae bacterium]